MKITFVSGESFSTVRKQSTPSWPEVVPGEKFMSSSTTSKGSPRSAAASRRGSRSVATRRYSFLSTSSAVSSTSASSSTIRMLPVFMFQIETQRCFEMEQPYRPISRNRLNSNRNLHGTEHESSTPMHDAATPLQRSMDRPLERK